MAKKPDMTVVKTFFFNHGERVALFTCIAVALLLIVWSMSGAIGSGTTTGKAWDEELSVAAKGLKQRIPPAPDITDEEKIKIQKEVKFPPVTWDRFASLATTGPYSNINEQPSTQRNNPTIFNVLAGDENFQFDLDPNGWQHYEVRGNKVRAIKDGGGNDKKGPAGPGGIGGIGGVGGAGGSGGVGPMGPAGMYGGHNAGGAPGNLCRVLQPRHMLVVTGIFPMKKQVDEFIKALRLRDVSELAAGKELPIIAGINVFREEYGPDGKRTHTEPALPLIYFNDAKKRLEIQPALEKELAEALYDQANPRTLRPIVHEGLVTPLPLLPEGKYPEVRIKSDNWPTKDMLADASEHTDNAMGPTGPLGGPMGPGRFGPKGGSGSKGSGGSGGQPPIIGGNKGSGPGMPGPMGPGGMMPGGMQGASEPAADVPTEFIPLSKVNSLDKDLHARLEKHQFNIFHPFGLAVPDGTPAAGGGSGQPDLMGGAGQSTAERFGYAAEGGTAGGAAGGMAGGYGGGSMPPAAGRPGGSGGSNLKGPGPMNPSGPGGGSGPPGTASGSAPSIYDAIVRFVDVDVKPLHSYRYYIQVRVKNPNHGKKSEVAQMIFAEIKELRSEGDWTPTPLFTVPGTYHLFAVDQYRVDHLGEKEKNAIDRQKASHTLKPKEEAAVVQLHRWFGKDGEYLIGDWAIVEWLRVRKGEAIGNSSMHVEIPTWSPGRGGFEMRTTLPPVKGKKVEAARKGVLLDFVPKVDMPPLLVDFAGGRKDIRAANVTIADDAAMDLLILTPEGRLVVRNSRADIDAELYNGTPKGTTRQARVEHWRKRNHEAETGGAAPASGDGGGAPILGPGR